MPECIKRYFFNKAVAKATKAGISTKLPEQRINTIVLLLERPQLEAFDSIKKTLIHNFDFQHVKIILFDASNVKEPIEHIFIDFVFKKKDFNFFGSVKREKLTPLTQIKADLFINLVEKNTVYSDRIMLGINSLFKVAFSAEVQRLASLTVDSGTKKEVTQQLELVSDYLNAFNGNTA
ncbi:MAG: hypothetical protein LBM67_06710 [Lentimicrobiaceae bacterium]|jgi:hypothetical protein|nr:hypothetical protein [Lentimicrobiaceae bacterium]